MEERAGSDAAGAFLRGEPAVVEEVRAAVEAAVRGFAFFEPDVSRDLVQDVLGRVVQSLRSGRFRGDAALTTYAFGVARYACIERSRRLRHETALARASEALDGQEPGPEASLLRTEEHRRNLRALKSLPQGARDLLHLVFVEGLSYREVGRRLGITEMAVKSRVHRCRMALRDISRKDASEAAVTSGRSGNWRD